MLRPPSRVDAGPARAGVRGGGARRYGGAWHRLGRERPQGLVRPLERGALATTAVGVYRGWRGRVPARRGDPVSADDGGRPRWPRGGPDGVGRRDALQRALELRLHRPPEHIRGLDRRARLSGAPGYPPGRPGRLRPPLSRPDPDLRRLGP